MRSLEDLISDPRNALIFVAILGSILASHFKLFEPAQPRGH